MSTSIDVTFTPSCMNAEGGAALVNLIRALPGVRKVFHSTKGRSANACCVMLNGIGTSTEIDGTIKKMEGVETTKLQDGFGYVEKNSETLAGEEKDQYH